MRAVIELGRAAREQRKISLKMPVRSVTVVSTDPEALEDVRQLGAYVRSELNARDLVLDSNESAWCTLRAAPDMSVRCVAACRSLPTVAR